MASYVEPRQVQLMRHHDGRMSDSAAGVRTTGNPPYSIRSYWPVVIGSHGPPDAADRLSGEEVRAEGGRGDVGECGGVGDLLGWTSPRIVPPVVRLTVLATALELNRGSKVFANGSARPLDVE